MTTKDWIYMSLLVLTGVAFYCNGYYAGVWRSRKVFESLLDQIEDEQNKSNDAQNLVRLDRFLGRAFPGRRIQPENPSGRLPEDFWNN